MSSCAEGRSSGQQTVQHRTQRIDICRFLYLIDLTRRLLRRHVTRRPQNLPRACEVRITFQPFGQSEISHTWLLEAAYFDFLGEENDLVTRATEALTEALQRRMEVK